jgi:crotonobetainyl-CoA:carnitine CoA-transferase CaiB-like acyl-CoA transferase
MSTSTPESPRPLDGFQVVSLAINLPGPLAVSRLHRLGALVVKVEPPEGDPLDHARAAWYRELVVGQEVVRLNLKEERARARLHAWLARADLLITATRPQALARLGLAWDDLHERYPRLRQVAIVGQPPPRDEVPGHDLTYQAQLGLVEPPALPRTCVADLAGAQEVVNAALGLMLARERGQDAGLVTVSLAESAAWFAEPLRHGLTASGGELGGGLAVYNLYRAKDGWIALAALEPHFQAKLGQVLGMTLVDRENLQSVFLTRTAMEWELLAITQDLPIAAVRDRPSGF